MSDVIVCAQDAGKQIQDMQLDAVSMKRRLLELHSNETAMVSEAVQLRTELARTQGELTRQVELTREAQASEAAMQARLSAEEKNNTALKAALDIQTQVKLLHLLLLSVIAYLPCTFLACVLIQSDGYLICECTSV